MKNLIQTFLVLLLVSVSAISCSKTDAIPATQSTSPTVKSNYSEIELEIIKLINDHRANLGLKALKINNFMSGQAKSHTDYMIGKNKIGHDNFDTRYSAISKELGSGYIAENVAYRYQTAQQVLDGWLKSTDGHKENIEGNKYTETGISVTADTKGYLYFTNIFYGL
jgi:uncharacterized protein YkwD